MLARIHAIPCEEASRDYLLDAHAETTWFLRSGTVPDYMLAHPDGRAVWQAVRDGLATLEPVPPGLVHIDYWSGNILWDGDRISTVLDWEEAAYGDPGYDVAYCRMDMVLSGMCAVADLFLKAYEAETGRRMTNLHIWELASAARPMFHAEGWISKSPSRELFQDFIANAME